MTADPVTLCLERLTDYRQFERFCCALLFATGHPGIEPLGGTGDGGRDAIFRGGGDSGDIAFAFTVRKDWFVKLKSDSQRLSETQTRVTKLFFLCTALLTAKDKDEAFNYIEATYNWHLELIDLEGLRMRIVNRPELISHHPSIFDPRFFSNDSQSYAQRYLELHGRILTFLNCCDGHLATEIEATCYVELEAFVSSSAHAELICHDHDTLLLLQNLHHSVRKVWEVISDEHYISAGWRWKFDNTRRPHVDVQQILRGKGTEIEILLEQTRVALQALAEFARGPQPASRELAATPSA